MRKACFIVAALLTISLLLPGCPKKAKLDADDRTALQTVAMGAKARAFRFAEEKPRIAAKEADDADAVRKWADEFERGLNTRAEALAKFYYQAQRGKLAEVDRVALATLVANICADEEGFRHMLPNLAPGPDTTAEQWEDFLIATQSGLADLKVAALDFAARIKRFDEKAKAEAEKSAAPPAEKSE